MTNKWSDIFGSEWAYIEKLGRAIHDPHAKKEFWENIKQRKMNDPKFSIYSLFPKSDNATKRAMEECCHFVKNLRKPKEDESA